MRTPQPKHSNEHRRRSISSRVRRNIRWRGNQMKKSRRKFLRDSACGLTAAAMISSLDQFSLVNAMVQNPQPDVASDYKALVCIFLFGRTDCNNMAIPFDDYNGGYFTPRN